MQPQDLLNRIDRERIAQLTLDLLKFSSPSGKEAEVSEFYARHLRNLGLDVQMECSYPESPSIIAYVRGSRPGKTLQLDGHIDTISADHPPAERQGDRLFGRGSCDMKGPLAAMTEAARILKKSGIDFAGNLMLTIHGQHEDAVGDLPMHAPLFVLFEKKLVGDAAIVCEGPSDGVVVAAKGVSFWEIDISRGGEPMHEVTSGGATNPIMVAHKLIAALEAEAQEWAKSPDPDVGTQSVFVGEIRAGDYYNRIPTTCHLKGTRRTIPGVTFDQMAAGFHALVNRIAAETGVEIKLKLLQSGQSYRLSLDEPVVKAVQAAHAAVTGKPLPPVGLRYTGNASQFNLIAKVPTLYYGADQQRAHATPEWVDLSSLEQACRVYLLSALHYLGVM